MKRFAASGHARSVLMVVVGLAAAGAWAGGALANWFTSDGSNPAVAVADSIRTGTTPTLAGVNGRDVALTWTAGTTTSGAGVTGYTVARYAAPSGGSPTAATGGCSGTVTVAGCTEQNAPAGTWYYALTPKLGLWVGPESGRLAVTVAAAGFSVTGGQTVKASGVLTGGSITHFKNGETVAFHLDSAAGTVVAASISAVDGTGTASGFTLTVPAGASDGSHTVVAVGGSGSQATSNSFSVDNTAPAGGSVTYTNGYVTTLSVSVAFSNGTDGGSGVNAATTQLTRSSASLSNGSCGTFGAFAPVGSAAPTSPFADTTVTSGNCFQYQYLVADNAGNTATYTSASVAKVDTSAPVFTLSTTGLNVSASGTTAFFKSGGVGAFTVTASDSTSGISASSFAAAPSGWTALVVGNTCTYTLATASASSSVVVSATNGAGTSSGNQTVTITVDGAAPTITASNLAIGPIDNTTTPGFVKAGGQYYVYANATDGASGVGAVTANVNSVTALQTALPLVAGSYSAFGVSYGYRSAAVTADAGLGAGNKSYKGTATDNVGNATTTANATVNVDNTAPTGSITSPSNGWASASTTVSSGSADAGAGVASAQFQYSPHGTGTWTTIGTKTASPYSLTWDTTALTDGGSYDLRVVTTDNASNSFTSATVTVTVDRTSPVAPSTPALAAASDTGVAGDNLTRDTTPTFTGTAEAGATVAVFDGATQIGTGTATAGAYSITVSTLAAGSHSITASATDAAGNVSTASAAVSVTIDAAAPTPTAEALGNGSGTAQKIDSGDTVTITYSEQLNSTSICSAWSSNSTVQSLSNLTLTVGDSGANDTLTASSSSCTLHVGTIVIGDYVASGGATSATFTSSTISWNPTTKTLTLTLGTLATSNTIKTGVTAIAPKYTPDAALADIAGNTMAASQVTATASSGF